MLQFIAGKIIALKTKLCLFIFKNFADFDFASSAGYRLANIRAPAPGTFVIFS